MKKAAIAATTVKVNYKMATPPVKTKPLASIVGAELQSNGHYASPADKNFKALGKVDAEIAKGEAALDAAMKVKPSNKAARIQESEETHKIVAKAAQAAGAKHVPAKPEDVKVEKLAKLSATVSKKKAAPAPDPAPTPQPDKALEEVTKLLTDAGFKYAAKETASGQVATGYKHRDGRAALVVTINDKLVGWTLKVKDATHEGGTPKQLEDALTPATTIAEQLHAEAVAKTPKRTDNGLPAHVVRAVEVLGGYTKQRYNLDDLRGDKNYGTRMRLLKILFNTEKVLAKDTGLNKLIEAFYSAVGATGKTIADRAKDFAVRCKKIAADERTYKANVKRAEKETIKKALKQTADQRTVPGVILPTAPRKTNKQRAKELAAAKQDILQLAVSAEQPAVPHPDATVDIVAADVMLLEDPKNGIVMMQIEKANSQGAICVYNNGSRVAAGVVPVETLNFLRPVKIPVEKGIGSNALILQAANQLLNPIVTSVPVTPVAARHLTAVIHCKELQPMSATATVALPSKGKKFAAPKSVPAKKLALVKKADKPAKAEKPAKKAAAAPRVVEDRKIKALITAKSDKMPREGTFCFAQVSAAISSKTVAEAQKKLDADKNNPTKGRRIEIAWMVKQGFIKVLD